MNIVYGGSFNPPTKAHKYIIDKLFELYNPDNLIVVPVGCSYKKPELIQNEHRFNMVKLLDNRIIVSDLEFKENYTGTYDLLNRLKRDYNDLYYVIGADNLPNLDKWIQFDKLLSEYNFIVFNRNNENLKKVIYDKYPKYTAHFKIIEANENISSSEFRKEKNEKYLTKEVYEYIIKNNLYEVK